MDLAINIWLGFLGASIVINIILGTYLSPKLVPSAKTKKRVKAQNLQEALA